MNTSVINLHGTGQDRQKTKNDSTLLETYHLVLTLGTFIDKAQNGEKLREKRASFIYFDG